jgi:hypothetical protein
MNAELLMPENGGKTHLMRSAYKRELKMTNTRTMPDPITIFDCLLHSSLWPMKKMARPDRKRSGGSIKKLILNLLLQLPGYIRINDTI